MGSRYRVWYRVNDDPTKAEFYAPSKSIVVTAVNLAHALRLVPGGIRAERAT